MRFVGIGGGSSVGIAAGGFVLWSAWGCIRESVLSSMVLRFRYTQEFEWRPRLVERIMCTAGMLKR